MGNVEFRDVVVPDVVEVLDEGAQGVTVRGHEHGLACGEVDGDVAEPGSIPPPNSGYWHPPHKGTLET